MLEMVGRGRDVCRSIESDGMRERVDGQSRASRVSHPGLIRFRESCEPVPHAANLARLLQANNTLTAFPAIVPIPSARMRAQLRYPRCTQRVSVCSLMPLPGRESHGDHVRQGVGRTGRKSSNLGRQPDPSALSLYSPLPFATIAAIIRDSNKRSSITCRHRSTILCVYASVDDVRVPEENRDEIGWQHLSSPRVVPMKKDTE